MYPYSQYEPVSKSLADILPRLCKATLSEHQQKQAVLWANWAEIIGERFTAQPIRINKTPGGTLFLRCPLKEAMELNYAIPLLLEKIRYFCGEHFITSIRIEQDYTLSTPSQKVESEQNLAHPTTLEEALGRLQNTLINREH